ncbi:PTS ascorbate transporter subunit IIC [bacterium]|nr:MAG: PTS ascorbate transporter subunit IIC [bacterium]
MVVLQFIVDEILSKPALLVGLIALIGLLALLKSPSDILTGSLKTILGFIILIGGAGILVGSLTPLGNMIQSGLHLHGVVPTNEAIVALAQKAFGAETAVIMAVGFLINLVLARVTPAKFVFLTGHHLFYMATLFAVVLGSANITGLNEVVLGSVMLGTMALVMPAFTYPFMRKLNGDAGFALGHFNSLGYIVSALVGKVVGKGSRSTEEIHVPERVSFLRDSLVMTTIVMIAFYLVFALIAGPGAVAKDAGTGNYVMYAFTQALTFGAGVAVILLGVRMVLAEIVPAFQGIAERFVPSAMPALDCPTTFPYAPNAVVIGFISSLVGGLVGLLLVGPIGLALIIPGMVPHFFDGGTAGVFGNSTGGRRGAVIGSFVNGLLITFLPALLLSFLGGLGLANTTFGDSDFAWAGIAVGIFAKTGIVGAYAMTLVFCAVLVAVASWISVRQRTGKETIEVAA